MHCILCHLPLKLNWGVCSQCYKLLPHLLSVCKVCGLPLYPADKPCQHCLKLKPSWDHLIAVCNYTRPLTKLIYQFKSNQKTEFAFPLARLMFLAWYQQRSSFGLIKPDIVACIPLHRSRYYHRGYNQAELLAKYIAHWMGCEYQLFLLKRNKRSQEQKNLSQKQRQQNVYQNYYCDVSLSGKSIAIIDDVVTTGNTIKEACKQLRLCHAGHIQTICLCRTSL